MSSSTNNDLVESSGVIITGGSGALGGTTAQLLAEAGRPVAVWGRNKERTEKVAESCRAKGVNAVGIIVDTTDTNSMDDAIAQSEDAIGAVGGLAMCHGMTSAEALGGIDFKVFDEVMDANVNSFAYIMQGTLPLLRKVGAGTSMVATLSTGALRGSAFTLAYCTAKHAALGLIRSAANSLAAEGIRVNAICPGAFHSTMLHETLDASGEEAKEWLKNTIPLGRVGEAIEIANVMYFLLSTKSSYMTGTSIPVDGGLSNTS